MNTTIVGDDGWSNVPTYVTYVIQGALIGGSNLIIVATVLRFAALRNAKEYLIMMSLSLADSFNMLGFVVAGIRRLHLVFTSQHHTFLTPWQCITTSHSLIWLFGEYIAGTMLLAVSVDRLLAVTMPSKYVKWSSKYALILVGITYGCTFITGFVMGLALMYVAKDNAMKNKIQQPAKCFSGGFSMTGVLPTYVTYYYMYASPTYALLSIVIYAFVWFAFKRAQRIKVTEVRRISRRMGRSKQTDSLARQRRITITLGIGCICTLFFYIIPYSLGYLLGGLVPDYLIMIFYILSNVNAFCNIFIYAMRHIEMKTAIAALFTCKSMPNNLDVWACNRMANKATKSMRATNRGKTVAPVELIEIG